MNRRRFLRAASGLFVPAILAGAQTPFTGTDVAYRSHTSPLALPTQDSNLWGWYRTDTQLSTLNSGGQDYLLNGTATWLDQSGSGHHFGCSNTANPKYNANIINGKPALKLDNTATMRFGSMVNETLNHPVSLFMLIRMSSHGVRYIVDGRQGCAQTAIAQNGTSPQIILQSASFFADATHLTISTWHVLTAIWDGASSVLQVDNIAETTGNVGTPGTQPQGLGFGGYTCSDGFMSFYEVAAIIVSASHVNSTNRAIHKNWLANYGGLSI